MTELDFQDVLDELDTDPYQVINLERNRGWLSLKGHLREKADKERTRIIKEMFRRGAEPVNQREVDYARGMIHAFDFILALPATMAARQERERA